MSLPLPPGADPAALLRDADPVAVVLRACCTRPSGRAFATLQRDLEGAVEVATTFKGTGDAKIDALWLPYGTEWTLRLRRGGRVPAAAVYYLSVAVETVYGALPVPGAAVVLAHGGVAMVEADDRPGGCPGFLAALGIPDNEEKVQGDVVAVSLRTGGNRPRGFDYGAFEEDVRVAVQDFANWSPAVAGMDRHDVRTPRGRKSGVTGTAKSRVLASVHETARDLHEAGAMDTATMRKFDALLPGDVEWRVTHKPGRAVDEASFGRMVGELRRCMSRRDVRSFGYAVTVTVGGHSLTLPARTNEGRDFLAALGMDLEMWRHP